MKRHLKKKSKKKRKKPHNLFFVFLFILFAIVLFIFILPKKEDSLELKKEKEKFAKKIFVEKIKISIVMDDLGQSMEPYSFFSKNNIPITLSFLPNLPYTKILSENLHNLGYEILIHIPMEPIGYPNINPGVDAILIFMDKNKIEEEIEGFRKEIPFAIGVNNHMGSAFTSNLNKMLEFMEILKKNDLFFLDSRTTPDTKGCEAAAKFSVPCFERSVFLDNVLEERYFKRQFEILLKKANRKGYGIAICHPHSETFKILKKFLPIWSRKTEIVKLSALQISAKFEK